MMGISVLIKEISEISQPFPPLKDRARRQLFVKQEARSHQTPNLPIP